MTKEENLGEYLAFGASPISEGKQALGENVVLFWTCHGSDTF